jgi:hypothetical protein
MLIKSARGALVFHGPQRSLDPFERANVEMSLVLWEVPEPLRRRIMALAPDEYWSPDVAALQILLAARR